MTDTDTARLFDIFLDVQSGLPRQGPGCAASTLEALALCQGLPENPAVLDIGCGPGLQTIALAKALGGHITAVDTNAEYGDALRARAADEGLSGHIDVVMADMAALPFSPSQFDLIWAEGSAYIMGVEAALAAWHPLLKPGGCVAVTELTWLDPTPPAEVAAFFGDEYPAMTDVVTNLATVRRCGYAVLGHFTLPDAAWWDDYYTPLQDKLPKMAAKYAGDEAAQTILEMTRREIEMRRRFADSYGYEFFVGQA